MFKQWVDKLKNLFESEEIEEVSERQYEEKQDIKAKMTYQYPENKPFPFPVIPDMEEPVEKNRNETPAYLRRREEDRRQVPPEKKESRKIRDEHTQMRKVYKDESAPPFQVTEVPSPIYGLQKRKNQVDHVPAYARREETIRHEKPLEEPKLSDEIAEAQDKSLDHLNESTESKLSEEDKLERDEQRKIHKKPVQQNERSRKQKRRERRKEVDSSKIPFNVVMTPSDRRSLNSNKIPEPKQTTEPLSTPKRATENTIITDNRKPKDIHAPIHLLNDPEADDPRLDDWIEDQQELLEQTLKHFHVAAKVVHATQGPSVTRFEVQPELGVKVSKIRNLSDDLKLNMAAEDIRIEAPIPGKNTVGIEVPNPEAQMVGLQEVIDTDEFKDNRSPLTIALGVSIEGKPKITNIQKMPHGLIAGATGSGKSVCINSILLSMIYKASHEDVKFLLIDPKMVELAPYNGIPHLVSPVITDVKAATQSLKWAVNEMEERYERFLEEGVRDIERYNEKVKNAGRTEEKMPYIVIVIDELADLMMMSPQDVESSISRIAQKARASGMHLLLATQRPSVDVITGLIKANIPTRIAFSVSSQVDSRTILDVSGAEKLLGRGDMLFMENGTGKGVRLQGPFVSDEEIERITAYARDIAEPNYLFEQEELLEQVYMEEEVDELLDEAIQFVMRQQSASTSMLQRQFKIGYNRAARLIDTMEARGMISGQNGSKPREVLFTEASLE